MYSSESIPKRQVQMTTGIGCDNFELDPARDAQETAADSNLLKRFKILHLVGTGNYARVYKGMTQNGKEVAIKSINLTKTSEIYRAKFLPRELAILKRINHFNICKVFQITQVSDRIFIMMQFCTRGTVADLLHKIGSLNEPVARCLFSQICDAVNYLHSNDLAHRDLKVENILLDNDYVPKLTDFSYSVPVVEINCQKQMSSPRTKSGSIVKLNANSNWFKNVSPGITTTASTTTATTTTTTATTTTTTTRQQRSPKSQKSFLHTTIKLNETFCGTLPYLSPEMIRQHPYDAKKTDIWSLGICLYVMLNDRLPFPFDDLKLMVRKQMIKDYKFKANIEFSDKVKSLTSMILEPDHTKRATCVDILKHPWMNGAREKPVG